MQNGRIAINGNLLPIVPTMADFETMFGPADRTSEKINRISSWDRYGVATYQSKKSVSTGAIDSVALWLEPTEYDFAPKTVFAGSVSVEGQRVDRSDPVESLARMPNAQRMFGTSAKVKGKVHEVYASGSAPKLIQLTFQQAEMSSDDKKKVQALVDDALNESSSSSRPRPASTPPPPLSSASTPASPFSSSSNPFKSSPPPKAAMSCPSSAPVDCGSFCCPSDASCSGGKCVRWVKQCPGGTSSCGDGYCCPYGSTCSGGGMCRRYR